MVIVWAFYDRFSVIVVHRAIHAGDEPMKLFCWSLRRQFHNMIFPRNTDSSICMYIFRYRWLESTHSFIRLLIKSFPAGIYSCAMCRREVESKFSWIRRLGPSSDPPKQDHGPSSRNFQIFALQNFIWHDSARMWAPKLWTTRRANAKLIWAMSSLSR
jgi:hypothetical protein